MWFLSWPWQFHALIGFGIFLGFGIWIIYDKQRRINDLEQGRPSITVFCEADYGWLRVVNSGNMADFTAKVQRIGEGLSIEDWFIKWKDSNQIEQRIYRGDNHILEVASCEFSLPIATGNGSYIKKPFIRLHTVGEQTTDETGGRVGSLEHDLSFGDRVISVKVRIFSNPELLSPFQKRYLFKLMKREDIVSIEEIPEVKDEL